jgi:TPR repeat protein
VEEVRALVVLVCAAREEVKEQARGRGTPPTLAISPSSCKTFQTWRVELISKRDFFFLVWFVCHNIRRPPSPRVRPRTEASERSCRTLDLKSTIGKKSREKRAKQLQREREREGKASPGASTSRVAGPAEVAEEVPPDHHDTPAAAATPSTDDTRDDAPASTAVSAADSSAAVAERLLAFCESCQQRLSEDIETWVDGELSGDIDAVKAAAVRGDAKALCAIGVLQANGRIPAVDASDWLCKAAAQGYPDAFFAIGVGFVDIIVNGLTPQGQEERTHSAAKGWLAKSAVDHNSADAQYLRGMFWCWKHGCARSKPDMLETARWFRMAAHQGLAEAQWELGEWFRRGVFSDVHMGFARKYIRRASKQGHAAALARMAELRRCVCCGAEGAARKCKLCLEARYCDAACTARHWREGGGGGRVGGFELPHKTACPRTHAADGASSDSGGDDGD